MRSMTFIYDSLVCNTGWDNIGYRGYWGQEDILFLIWAFAEHAQEVATGRIRAATFRLRKGHRLREPMTACHLSVVVMRYFEYAGRANSVATCYGGLSPICDCDEAF